MYLSDITATCRSVVCWSSADQLEYPTAHDDTWHWNLPLSHASGTFQAHKCCLDFFCAGTECLVFRFLNTDERAISDNKGLWIWDVWVYGRHLTCWNSTWRPGKIPLCFCKKKEQQNPALHLLCSDVRSSIFSSHEDINGLIVNHQTEYHPEISTSFPVC